MDELHGLEHTLMVFLRRKEFQRLLLGNLDVHAHAVSIVPCLVEQFLRTTGDALQMDVAVEAMNETQIACNGS